MNCIKEVLQEKGRTKGMTIQRNDRQKFKMVNAYACNRKQPSLETLFGIADLMFGI